MYVSPAKIFLCRMGQSSRKPDSSQVNIKDSENVLLAIRFTSSVRSNSMQPTISIFFFETTPCQFNQAPLLYKSASTATSPTSFFFFGWTSARGLKVFLIDQCARLYTQRKKNKHIFFFFLHLFSSHVQRFLGQMHTATGS